MWETFKEGLSTVVAKVWDGAWEIGTSAYNKITGTPEAPAGGSSGGASGTPAGSKSGGAAKKEGWMDWILGKLEGIPFLGDFVKSAKDLLGGTGDLADGGRIAGTVLGGLFGSGLMMLFGFSPLDGLIPFALAIGAAIVGSVIGPQIASALSAPATPAPKKTDAKNPQPEGPVVKREQTGPDVAVNTNIPDFTSGIFVSPPGATPPVAKSGANGKLTESIPVATVG